jgi:nucleoside-diphosphate-sugar epimerase
VRVFIIGATGVIGSRVVAALIARGDAVSTVSRSPENRKRLDEIGARAIDVNLQDSTARVTRYVQESFAPVYPDCGDRWIDESVPIRPARYNRGVADAEAAALSFPGGVVLRFGYFYGPDRDFTRDMIAMVRRGWSPLPGRPEAYTSPVSHDDAADAVVAALDVLAGIYNVVDDEPVTHRDFAGSLAAHP